MQEPLGTSLAKVVLTVNLVEVQVSFYCVETELSKKVIGFGVKNGMSGFE